jgi:hypothetical protein
LTFAHDLIIWLSTLNLISTFSYLSVDASDGGLLIPGDIIRPVVGASAQTWFIRYIYIAVPVPLVIPVLLL